MERTAFGLPFGFHRGRWLGLFRITYMLLGLGGNKRGVGAFCAFRMYRRFPLSVFSISSLLGGWIIALWIKQRRRNN